VVAGLGGGTENDPADAAAGHSSPLPSKAPAAAAAAPPKKARRESPSRRGVRILSRAQWATRCGPCQTLSWSPPQAELDPKGKP
jgi:hypothetical protein